MNKLSRMLSKRLSETNMSIRRAGIHIGVSNATVARAISGETVEVDTLVRIADFLRVSIISLIDETAKSFTRVRKYCIIFVTLNFRFFLF